MFSLLIITQGRLFILWFEGEKAKSSVLVTDECGRWT